MANYVYNTFFIKGSKQSIVDFINRGLKGCKSSVRFSADMSVAKIANCLMEPGTPVSMQSYMPTGCPENEPFDIWNIRYETEECVCISTQIDTTQFPVAFLRHINGMNGITLYAYAFPVPTYQAWYQYNGRTDELTEKDVLTDPRFEQYKEALKQQADYNPKTVDAEASYKVLEGYLQDFRKELNEEMLFPLQNVR